MQAFWFGVIAVLWAGFFLLEGFDFGVGVLYPFVGRDAESRAVAYRSIGPVWDGNEVWLLVAGGATFAAFPAWYASMFSGFYLAFALLLAGLIIRGIGLEYRGKVTTDRARWWCDLGFVAGSAIPALLLGVAFADIVRGVQLDADGTMTNSFVSLLNPYALLGGVVTLTLFAFHGAVFLGLRTTGPVRHRARDAARMLAPIVALAAVAFAAWTMTIRGGWVSIVLAFVVVVAFLGAVAGILRERDGWAFTLSAVTVALVPVWLFSALWPDVLPARNNAAFSLTVHNASSTHHTLAVMTGVALVMTPIVLAYQIWTYWVFRARVTGEDVRLPAGPARLVESARHSLSELTGQAEPTGQAPHRFPATTVHRDPAGDGKPTRTHSAP